MLPGDPTKVLRPADFPELSTVVGKTVITTDGTTLLGADDKAGVAVIMEAAEHLMAHPEIAHGPIRVCFTCDEEIGRGVDHVDLKKLGAVVGYTLDGMAPGRDRRRDVLGRPGDGHDHRREHPSVDRQGEDGQRGPPRRPVSGSAAAGYAGAGSDRGPRGVPASVPHRGRRAAGDTALPAARFRHAEAGRAGRAAAVDRPATGAGVPGREDRRRGDEAVPQHGRRREARAAGGELCDRGDAACRPGAEDPRASAAAPTARG